VKPIHNPTTPGAVAGESTQETNARYQSSAAVKDTVFRFYQLVLTQWPVVIRNQDGSLAQGTPGNTFPGKNFDSSAFANSVIETFRQSRVSDGCMNCHDMATTDAFSDFVWFPTTRAVPPPGMVQPTNAVAGGTLSLAPVRPQKLDSRLEGLQKFIKSGKR